jgi:hypothetical protein
MTLFQYIMQSVSTKKRCNTALFRWAGRFRFDLLPRRFLPAQIARLARSIKGDESKRANQIAQGGIFCIERYPGPCKPVVIGLGQFGWG